MRYLHTMLRVRNLDAALKFYQDALGLRRSAASTTTSEIHAVFLCAAEDEGLLKASKGRGARWSSSPILGQGKIRRGPLFRPSRLRGRRHLCDLRPPDETRHHHQRPPRDGQMAFVRSPDLHSIELLQKGDAKPPAEPWTRCEHRTLYHCYKFFVHVRHPSYRLVISADAPFPAGRI